MAAKKPRKSSKKAEPGSKGFSPSDCREAGPAAKALAEKIEAAGGALLTCYREPLGGTDVALAVLPVDKVKPTPFQRDLSETHAKRLGDTIGKIGIFLDPIIAVPVGAEFWTPNGRHRLESMTRLGAKSITALVLPDPAIQYKILALNVEKAHNLREKSLEVIRMYRALVEAGGDGGEEAHALEFEEPAFATLGLCYEQNGRFAGGAYNPILRRLDGGEEAHALEFEEPAFATLGLCYELNGRFAGGAYNPILRRLDGWIDGPLAKALKEREKRSAKVSQLDEFVAKAVAGLQAKGFKSPYLKAFVVARCNALRFMKTMPPFDEGLDDILKKAERFNIEKVKDSDISASAGPADSE